MRGSRRVPVGSAPGAGRLQSPDSVAESAEGFAESAEGLAESPEGLAESPEGLAHDSEPGAMWCTRQMVSRVQGRHQAPRAARVSPGCGSARVAHHLTTQHTRRFLFGNQKRF